jgi:hypothetical protein
MDTKCKSELLTITAVNGIIIDASVHIVVLYSAFGKSLCIRQRYVDLVVSIDARGHNFQTNFISAQRLSERTVQC